MPAQTERQRRFLSADLGRAQAGQPTKTGMSQAKLKHFVKAPVKRKGSR